MSKAYVGDYAVYKGDEFLALGSAEECAEELGVRPNYIRFLASDSAKKRVKNPDEATIAIKLDE